jgi:hypothetical protein
VYAPLLVHQHQYFPLRLDRSRPSFEMLDEC